jgi:predicted RNA-binding protein YlxR (DUF448 family)
VAGKSGRRVKHIPQRTCVGCHLVLPKRALIRLVRSPDGVMVDPSGKAAGRGAYLHNRRLCWERGMKGPVAHALKVELTDADRRRLQVYMDSLPAEVDDETSADAPKEQPMIC